MKLTSANVITEMEKKFTDELNGDVLMWLSFCMDFAISTRDIGLVKDVHNHITYYFLRFSQVNGK